MCDFVVCACNLRRHVWTSCTCIPTNVLYFCWRPCQMSFVPERSVMGMLHHDE